MLASHLFDAQVQYSPRHTKITAKSTRWLFPLNSNEGLLVSSMYPEVSLVLPVSRGSMLEHTLLRLSIGWSVVRFEWLSGCAGQSSLVRCHRARQRAVSQPSLCPDVWLECERHTLRSRDQRFEIYAKSNQVWLTYLSLHERTYGHA